LATANFRKGSSSAGLPDVTYTFKPKNPELGVFLEGLKRKILVYL
jgi:hypothetical protein